MPTQSAAKAAASNTCVVPLRPDSAMDKVIWAAWYDLPADRTQEYLSWLHERYLPELQKRPGYDWVAHYRQGSHPAPDVATYMEQMRVTPEAAPELGRGNQFILMAGSTELATFLMPGKPKPDQAVSDEDRQMLALRQGLRWGVMKDVVRGDGPAVGSRPLRGPPAPMVQFGTWRVNEGMDQGMWDFYLGYRFPQIAASPGAVSARALTGCVGWMQAGILYEFATKQAHADFLHKHERPAVQRDRSIQSANKTKNISLHAPGSPVIGERIWPPVKT